MGDAMTLGKQEHYRHSHILGICILSCTLIGSILLLLKNVLLFHTIVELFAVVIGLITFIIAMNTYKINKNQYLLFLGVAYGFVACFDLLHTLTYQGMNIISIEGANIPTQLWIIARYVESISIFIAALLVNKALKFGKIIFTYFICSVFLVLSVFLWYTFPDAFIDGVGLTNFKIASEYIICGILIVSRILIKKNKNSLDNKTYKYMVASIYITIVSELLFTLYTDVYGITNMTGHILKVVSFYLVYKAIVEVGIKMPYEDVYRSEARYRNLIELFPENVSIISGRKIMLANRKFSQLLGFEESYQLVGKHLEDCVDVYWYSTIEKYKKMIYENKETEVFGEEILILGGKEIIMEISISYFPYEAQDAILMILRDITERKKAEELARKAEENKKRLDESLEYDKMKTEFYSNLSHEMRTPLNLIYSTVQILELQLKSKLEETEYASISKYIFILRQNFYRMLRLVNNLLDITKIDAGYFKLELGRYNIVNVVEEITLSIADYIEKKDITLIFDTDVEEKIVAIDPNAIERIMLNLLSNAIKFTDAGEEISVNIYDKEDKVVISVKDTGVGIPKEKLKGIFDRFTQIEKTLKRNQQGTGIGLSLVESLVKMHGGEICVYSEFGEGTEFVIELPAQKIDYEDYDVEDYDAEQVQDRYVEKINIEFSDIYSTSNAI